MEDKFVYAFNKILVTVRWMDMYETMWGGGTLLFS